MYIVHLYCAGCVVCRTFTYSCVIYMTFYFLFCCVARALRKTSHEPMTTSPFAHAEVAIRNWTRHRTVEDCYCFLLLPDIIIIISVVTEADQP